MNFIELNPPIIEFPAHQIWHRIQRKTARKDSVRINGFVLAPSGGLAGRFDLADEPTAYLGDSPETALSLGSAAAARAEQLCATAPPATGGLARIGRALPGAAVTALRRHTELRVGLSPARFALHPLRLGPTPVSQLCLSFQGGH